ncbi:MAG: AAA family ATPase [Chitinophagaceae bacterium]|nr:AAA family ATPase [Chitinophagaceae bacterium]
MSIIENIEIKNFKSIRNLQKIEGCKKINVFVGPPNVGKSNVLEALSLLTFIHHEKRQIGLADFIRFEKFTQLFNLPNLKSPGIINFNNQYSLSIHYEDESAVKLIMNDSNKVEYSPYTLSGLEVGRTHVVSKSSTDGIDDFSGFFPESKQIIVKPYKFNQDKIFLESFSALELKIPNGDNLSEVVINNKEVLEFFSTMLKPYGLESIIDGTDLKMLLVREDGTKRTLPLNLLADTILRLLFYKTAICSNVNSVLLFEEPESHCYEPYIMEITNSIKNDTNNNQFFIVTHSQFIIDELLRDKESRENTNIYLVGFEDSETKVKLLKPEVSTDVYQSGLNVFFNFKNLWDEN